MLFLWIFQHVFTHYTKKSKTLSHYKLTNLVFKVRGSNTRRLVTRLRYLHVMMLPLYLDKNLRKL